MAVVHDLRCPGCDAERMNVLIPQGVFPECEWCGTPMKWIPFVAATDVLGSTHVTADGEHEYTSQRELDKKMKEDGWRPAGDKQHGARPEMKTGTLYSYPKQGTRSA